MRSCMVRMVLLVSVSLFPNEARKKCVGFKRLPEPFISKHSSHSRAFLLFLISLALSCLSGCTPITRQAILVPMPTPACIQDIALLPQNAAAYLNPSTSGKELIPYHLSKLLFEKFKENHFAPWHRKEPLYSKDVVSRGRQHLEYKNIYGENTLPRDKEWLYALDRMTAMESYPNTHRWAIAITNSNLRVLPTTRPAFYDFGSAGEGYPFDHLQISAVWGGTPLFISHTSADGSWLIAETPFASGWIPVSDIAYVDEPFIKEYETNRLAALIKDEIPISDHASRFRFMGKVGSVFPIVAAKEGAFEILIPAADWNRNAILLRGNLSRERATEMPLAATPENIASLINELLRKPYGWGGLYENRDCSSTMKDLFTPFGIWLPRSSPRQAREGFFIPLQGLELREKEKTIIRNAVPFLTLLWMPGHIGLYIGEDRGRALIFHSTWGIKTKDSVGREGRKIIGETVITTLQPGIELPDILLPGGNLLYRIAGMTLLTPEGSAQDLNAKREKQK